MATVVTAVLVSAVFVVGDSISSPSSVRSIVSGGSTLPRTGAVLAPITKSSGPISDDDEIGYDLKLLGINSTVTLRVGLSRLIAPAPTMVAGSVDIPVPRNVLIQAPPRKPICGPKQKVARGKCRDVW